MPTGYTSYIQDGKIDNAKDFLLLCARDFGAAIDMREESLDKEIPEFKPNNYYLEQLEKAQQRLKEFQNKTDDEIQKGIDKQYIKKIENANKGIKESEELAKKYKKVLNEIENWSVPTNEHINLKKFAIDQITHSIEIDCGIEYYEEILKTPKLTVKEYKKTIMNMYLDDIERYSRQYKDECNRVYENNKWINNLKASLENL